MERVFVRAGTTSASGPWVYKLGGGSVSARGSKCMQGGFQTIKGGGLQSLQSLVGTSNASNATISWIQGTPVLQGGAQWKYLSEQESIREKANSCGCGQ